MAQPNLAIFPRQSVWRLIVIVLGSLGCCIALWLWASSRALDRNLPGRRIASWYSPVSAGLTCASLALVLAELRFPDAATLHVVTRIAIYLTFLLLLIWTFKVRNRVNLLLRSTRRSPFWLHGFWTATLGVVYIQKQINEFRSAQSRVHTRARFQPRTLKLRAVAQ
jgi:hypothetical protein